MAPRVLQGYPYIRNRAIAALDLEGGDYDGTVVQGMTNVVVAEDLTQHRSLWLRRGYSWECGAGEIAPLASVPAFLFRANGLPANNGVINRLFVLTRLRVWSVGGGAIQFGWQVLNTGSLPVLTGTTTLQPTVRDSRQGTVATSLYGVTVGNFGGIALNASGWARGGAAGSNGVGLDIDPKICIRYGEAFIVQGQTPATSAFGVSLAWDEYQATDEEMRGDQPVL